MKLGVFDSGLGGLLIAKAIQERMPDMDMLYAGDTLHLPYGNRSPETIYEYTRNAIEFLFEQDCAMIVVACNTASAGPLRRLQQEYLPNSRFSERRILGVIVPTLEYAIEKGHQAVGLIATNHTIRSNIYDEELRKINPDIKLVQISAPLLVPMIENDGVQWIDPVLEHYLQPMKDAGVQSLIFGCTHYSLIRDKIRAVMGADVELILQDDIIPGKLEDYLARHQEISQKISRNGKARFLVSDTTPAYERMAVQVYGSQLRIEKSVF